MKTEPFDLEDWPLPIQPNEKENINITFPYVSSEIGEIKKVKYIPTTFKQKDDEEYLETLADHLAC